MILASHAGHGGIFAKILNHQIFVHISKLTYGLYLVHPIIISVLYGWQDHSTHSDLVSVVGRTGFNMSHLDILINFFFILEIDLLTDFFFLDGNDNWNYSYRLSFDDCMFNHDRYTFYKYVIKNFQQIIIIKTNNFDINTENKRNK